MKKINYLIILVLIVLISNMWGQTEKIAVALKVNGTVEYKHSDEDEFSKTLKQGAVLQNEDVISTGKQGYAVLVFIDDKSQLTIHENTEFVIQRKQTDSNILKRVSMQYGKIKANVNRQKNDEFIISTPTSVAAVKGTIFWILSDPDQGDQFFGVEGMVEIENLISNRTIMMLQQEKTTSTPDGEIDKEKYEQQELPGIGSSGQDEDMEEEVLRIRFKNDEGEIKYLEIKYEE
ncbi:MAG TPA: FecR family protein [bacterium]|nr:FecR family protein [bacterium]